MEEIKEQLKLIRRELGAAIVLISILASMILYYVSNKDLVFLFGSFALAIVLLIAGINWYYQDKKEKIVKHKPSNPKKHKVNVNKK